MSQSQKQKSQKQGSAERSKSDYDILVNSIDAKRGLLKKVSAALNDAEIEGQARLAKIEESIAAAERTLDSITDSTNALVEKYTSVTRKVHTQSGRARQVQEDLDARRKYLAQQEQVIANMTEEGNVTMRGLQYEVAHLEKIKDQVNGELLELNRRKSQIFDDTQLLEKNCAELQEEYDQSETELQGKIDVLEEQIVKQRNILDDFKTERQAVITELKKQEEALDAKRRALHIEADEIATAKRRMRNM